LKNLILLYLLLSIISIDCGKDFSDPCDSIEPNQSSIEIDLKPEKPSYVIGDTIWLSSRFDIDLELTNKDERININNANGWLALLLMHLDGGKEVKMGYDDFDVINEHGELSQAAIFDEVTKNYSGRLTFNCDTLFCSFTIGLVPKSKGNYCVASNGGWIDVNYEGSLYCDGASLRENNFTTKSFNREIYEELNIDFPIELLTTRRTTDFDIIDNDGAYAFKVK